MALKEGDARRQSEAEKLARTASDLRDAATEKVGKKVTQTHIEHVSYKSPYGKISTSWVRGVENARGPYWHNEKKLRSLAWVYGLEYQELLDGKTRPAKNAPVYKDVPQYVISAHQAA